MSQTRTRTVRNPANQGIVDMLETQLEETTSTNYKHTLRKALRAIRVFNDAIDSKEKALEVPGVGQHTATAIQLHLLDQQAARTPSGGALLLPEAAPAPVSSPLPMQRRPRARQNRREYVPQYRTTPYAILIALYHAQTSGVSAMRKEDLARSAQQYCDKPILTTASDDPSTWYDGWSSVNKTLVAKGLVARGGRPIMFSLSAMGTELAERLVEMNNGALTMGAREYRPDGPVTAPVTNSPVARRIGSAASESGRSDVAQPTTPGFASTSQDFCAALNQPQIQSQEDAEAAMAQTLAKQFAAEEAAMARNQRTESLQTVNPTRQLPPIPTADPETASALERKYRNGREFGVVAPGVPPSSSPIRGPASRARRKRFTAAMCDRATRAIQRLEAGGYSRADCIKIVEILHSENGLPRTVDAVYQAVVKALWEAEKQDRRLGGSSQPLGLRIISTDSDESGGDTVSIARDDDDPALNKEASNPQESMGPGSIPSVLRNPDEGKPVSPPTKRPTSRTATEDPIVVIDLDNEGDSDLAYPPLSERDSQHPPLSNPARSSRASEVIALDSDVEDEKTLSEKDASVLQIRGIGSAAVYQRVLSRNHEPNQANRFIPTTSDNGFAHGSVPEQIGACSMKTAVEENVQTSNNGDSVIEEDCRVILLLDTMERFGNSHTMTSLVESPADLLFQEGVPCEVRSLPTGDTLFVARFSDGSEVVLDYIVERKTIEDYGASMKDGRVQRQSYLMRQAGIKRRVFLLEGVWKDNEDLYNKTELHKKLAEMTMCSGLYVKHTRDMQDTVHFYASLYRRLQTKFLKQPKALTLKGRIPYSEWKERMSSMKKTLTVQQLFMIQLCHIPGIGTTKAQAIINMGYTTPFLLYSAYKSLKSMEEREGMLNNGEHAIGSRYSKAVAHLFNQREYPTVAKKE